MLTSLLLPLVLLCQTATYNAQPPEAAADTTTLSTVHISTEQWQGFTHPDLSGA